MTRRAHRSAGTTRRLARAALLAGLGVALLGCGPENDEQSDPGDPGAVGAIWAPADDPLDPAGVVWAAEGVVHLDDGTTIDTGRSLEAYVVAGDGVYFLPAPDAETGTEAAGEEVSDLPTEEAHARAHELWFADAEGSGPTGAYASSLRASPNGRYLAFMDPVTGPTDAYDTPLREAVVVDLIAGEEVLRTGDGMGDVDSDDLLDLYEDAGGGGILSLDDDEVAIAQVEPRVASYRLTAGEAASAIRTIDREAWDRAHPAASSGDPDPWNPARTWRLVDTGPTAVLVADDGTRLTPRPGAPTWSLFAWVGDDTALGYAVDAPAADGEVDVSQDATLMTCTVPDGACTLIEDSTGPFGTVLLPATSG